MNWLALVLATQPPSFLSDAVVASLAIGVPSLVVAVSTFWLATRAKRESMRNEHDKVDAEAYTRAKELYESAIAELRREAIDLREENARLRQAASRLVLAEG